MPFAPTDSSARWTRFAGRRGWALVGGVTLVHGMLLWGAGMYRAMPAQPVEPVTVMLASVLPMGTLVPMSLATPAPAQPSKAAPVDAAALARAKLPEAAQPAATTQRDTRLPEPVLSVPGSAAPVSVAPPSTAASPSPASTPTAATAGPVASPGSTEAAAARSGGASASAVGSAASIAGQAGAGVELPSSDASYLQNPRPEYPRISRQRGEQGRVLVRVLIGTDGNAQKAEISQSSGFSRLDQSALNAVSNWRFVPGKRNGVPEAMWFTVPVGFCLSADGVQCQP